MSDQDLSKMKVADLRASLKAKGLNIVGNKQELVERLQAAMSDTVDLEDSKSLLLDHDEDELLNDDVLNDDDLDEEKSLLDSTHDEILQSPSESTKSTSPENISVPIKKVTLKRNISVTVPIIEAALKTDDAEKQKLLSTSSSEPDKKVIKMSELTAKDRLELRAKKFGSESVGAKEARAARFGIAKEAISSEKSTTANPSSPASIDLLKKRAERFGMAIAPEVKKSEVEEKLTKRAERFGASGKKAITGPPATTATKSVYAEKARARLERFKQAA